MTKRKEIVVTLTLSSPEWLSRKAALREVRAIFQGYPGFATFHGEGKYLDDVGVGNGLRAKSVK
ncbi:hypothetical protein [Sphingobium lignivorans]|uniref:Uncharacterized protein n=1 Tax=Sphingobium lignivorans TaxID=2735886 RepID=A0ABR6NFC9_9SPHN|nr:hypothetical protein [Sphingobium lignivorans]MBB5985999.1 hypothetical protein [Sphingobium lignivorans]